MISDPARDAMTPLDPERTLALAYVPATRRAALAALWRLDTALGAALVKAGDPMAARLRLAWWREALERLDREQPPAEPVLEALAAHVLTAGVAGAELAAMEEGWSVLAEPGRLGPEALAVYARERGGRLFALSARLLGGPPQGAAQAGEAWVLADLARRTGDRDEAREALDAIRPTPEERWPAPLRPLGMLAALARRDAARGAAALEPWGAPARMLRMVRLRLTGR